MVLLYCRETKLEIILQLEIIFEIRDNSHSAEFQHIRYIKSFNLNETLGTSSYSQVLAISEVRLTLLHRSNECVRFSTQCCMLEITKLPYGAVYEFKSLAI